MYDVAQIYPRSAESAISDDEITNNKKKKHFKPDENTQNSVIIEGPISKFLNRHHNIVKRYLVLNSVGIFVYKDLSAFQGFPTKPAMVMPFNEIVSVN